MSLFLITRPNFGEGNMRLSVLLVGVSAVLTLASPISLSPAVADEGATCVNGNGDERIAACTRAINSGRSRGSRLAVVCEANFYSGEFALRASSCGKEQLRNSRRLACRLDLRSRGTSQPTFGANDVYVLLWNLPLPSMWDRFRSMDSDPFIQNRLQ
jgi:hypothetical protein